MKTLKLTLALLLITIGMNAQGLNENAQSIKDKVPDLFEKLELIVQEDYKESDAIYTIMINTQANAVFDYFGIPIKTGSDEVKLARAMKKSSKTINGIDCVNYVLLVALLKV
tara:strand:- start:548 stop:883 length:336 start_codon:yes stop_codon:yes gene_type:complete